MSAQKHMDTHSLKFRQAGRRLSPCWLNIFTAVLLTFTAIALMQSLQLGRLLDNTRTTAREASLLRAEHESIIRVYKTELCDTPHSLAV